MPTDAELRIRLVNARRQVEEAEEMARSAEQWGDGGRVEGHRTTAARARLVVAELEARLAATAGR